MSGPDNELHAHPPGVVHVHGEVAAGRLRSDALASDEEVSAGAQIAPASAMTIGSVVRRDTAGSKWHYVESIVADDAVTRCGKRMSPATDEGVLLVADALTDVLREDKCGLCYG